MLDEDKTFLEFQKSSSSLISIVVKLPEGNRDGFNSIDRFQAFKPVNIKSRGFKITLS